MISLGAFRCFCDVRFFALRILLGLSALALTGCGRSSESNQKDTKDTAAAPAAAASNHIVMETDKGTIEIELLPNDAPKAAENFRLLAERGYYDGLTFHRIVKGFMIQGGDPLGTGMGGESAWGGPFADEINRSSPLYRGGYKRGLVAMANSGPNTNTSQFFIMHQDYGLPPGYTIFGRVTKGMEVVDALATVPTRRGPDGGMSQPITPVVMKKVRVRE